MTEPLPRIRLGISACLLGHNVRYDGGHKLDRYLVTVLGRYVEWVPVCPEVECGLGVPREPIRLVGAPDAPNLMTVTTGIDITDRMQSTVASRVEHLAAEDLSGFVFKNRSPSCGLYRVKVYDKAVKGSNSRAVGSGLFAAAFTHRFPLLPVEEEGRLHDSALRENFIERVFAYARWQRYVHDDGSREGLVDFHDRHRLLIRSHSPTALRKLERLIAGPKRIALPRLHTCYLELFMTALGRSATVKKHADVLVHISGVLRHKLTENERAELQEVIGRYRQCLVSLVVPITVIQHYIRHFDKPALQRQWYLHPEPDELMLRNRV